MSETLSEKNVRFVEFYEDLIESAISPPNRRQQGLQSKVLLATIFDSLSKSGVNKSGVKIQENRLRFTATLEQHTTWLDRERVSLLHLVRAFELEKKPTPLFDSVRAWAESNFANNFPLSKRLLSNDSAIARDPLLSEVQALWPRQASGLPQSFGSLRKPEDLQHKNLFWLYRNSLVHEFRIPGQGMEQTTVLETEPYYQEVSTIIGLEYGARLKYTKNWELVYPTGFFHRLTLEALARISTLHIESNSSPFDDYSQGTYWLPAFNEC